MCTLTETHSRVDLCVCAHSLHMLPTRSRLDPQLVAQDQEVAGETQKTIAILQGFGRMQ